jgi:tetratricopeptide (TPR) repeat protein
MLRKKMTAEDYCKLGNVNQDKGMLPEAITDYTRALDIDTDYAAAYYHRGNAYQAQGRPVKAMSDYNLALNLDPNHAAAYYHRGNIYQAQEKPEKAIADYTRALELHPKLVLALVYRDLRVTHLVDKGGAEKGIAVYTQALKPNPQIAAAYFNLGNACYTQGKFTEAIANYTLALKLDPTLAAVYFNRGCANQAQGELAGKFAEKTGEELFNVMNDDPSTLGTTWKNFNNAFQAKERFAAEAISDYTQAIEQDPMRVDAYYNCGNAYFAQGKFTEAIANYTQALKLDPTDAPAYTNRGKAYQAQGNIANAISDYTQAMELDPKLVLALDNLNYLLSSNEKKTIFEAIKKLSVEKQIPLLKQCLDKDKSTPFGKHFSEPEDFFDWGYWENDITEEIRDYYLSLTTVVSKKKEATVSPLTAVSMFPQKITPKDKKDRVFNRVVSRFHNNL